MRLEAKRRGAAARLNALLARSIDAPLARPAKLRALPSDAALAPAALMERARAANPSLAGGDAQIAAAAAGKQLADKSWYPDVMLNGNGQAGAVCPMQSLPWRRHHSGGGRKAPVLRLDATYQPVAILVQSLQASVGAAVLVESC